MPITGVRAMVISAGGVVDAAGQMVGGPIIGLIGTAASLRIGRLARLPLEDVAAEVHGAHMPPGS